jgi:patatin-related protein
VSLAVYQHGITKEILKLVRASKAYHAAVEQQVKQHPAHVFHAATGGGVVSTERVYFEVLKMFGGLGLDLRVIVDVIAGASSGGINGVILARAIAHDLSIDRVTDMWLRDVDISRLLAPEARPRSWSKWYVRPFVRPLLWMLARRRLLRGEVDRETRRKLSMFLRSRWFEPPLDGGGLTALLLDALEAMGEPPSRSVSLLPANQRLDLLVTVTDARGAGRLIYMHDPPVVQEREHRHVLRFACEYVEGIGVRGDFGLDNVPSLAFAARATASFPGAFPPVQLREMDAILARRGREWTGRGRFLDVNFRHYRERGLDPEMATLLDGSVLDNKPFRIPRGRPPPGLHRSSSDQPGAAGAGYRPWFLRRDPRRPVGPATLRADQ